MKHNGEVRGYVSLPVQVGDGRLLHETKEEKEAHDELRRLHYPGASAHRVIRETHSNNFPG